MGKSSSIRIERRTYDGILSAYWGATVIRQRSRLLIWHAPPLTPIIYPHRNFSTPLRRHELGWIWLDRRYTVTVELSPEGGLERAVCQVCQPPVLAGEVVSITELGLALIVEPGPTVRIDDDEFQEASNDYGYDPQLRANAWTAIEDARKLLEQGAGPFGPDLEKMHSLALRDVRSATT